MTVDAEMVLKKRLATCLHVYRLILDCKKSQNISNDCSQIPYDSGYYVEDAERGLSLQGSHVADGSDTNGSQKCLKYPEYHLKKIRKKKDTKRTGLQLQFHGFC